MLYSAITGKPVFFPPNRELSEHQKRVTVEKLEPLPYKGHKMFRLEERAKIIG